VWLDQHAALDRLGLQARAAAAARASEPVVDALVALDRLGLLVAELLVAEAWADRALPLLRGALAAPGTDPTLAYFIVRHEATVAGLLEVALHHAAAAAALPEEAALELCDWGARRLARWLEGGGKKAAASAHKQCAAELAAATPAEELAAREAAAAEQVGLAALALLRHLSEHAPRLSLGVAARLAGAGDAAGAAARGLLAPPWERPAPGGGLERLDAGGWRRVPPAERRRLCAPEAQAWLLLYNVMLDPVFAPRLRLSAAATEELLRLRPHLAPPLLEQLPPLRGLARALDELALGAARSAPIGGRAGAAAAAAVVEAPPGLRAALIGRVDWPALAAAQRAGALAPGVRALTPARAAALLRGFDFLCGVEEAAEAAEAAAKAGPPRAAALEAFADAGGGRWAWHASYALELDAAAPPEAVSVAAEAPLLRERGGAAGGAAAAAAAAKVRGWRFRLAPLPDDARPLPPAGRLVLSYAGAAVEAALELPAAGGRDASALPAALWVTVGGLAAGGLALQLRLRRLNRAAERAGAGGAWCAYAPAGGALSVRDGLLEEGSS
jgi:hypothetical protein